MMESLAEMDFVPVRDGEQALGGGQLARLLSQIPDVSAYVISQPDLLIHFFRGAAGPGS